MSAAAAPSAKKRKANEPTHSLSGTPPPPHANIAKYKLLAELAHAYATGVLSDPEDAAEYKKYLENEKYISDNNFKKDTSTLTKNTLIGIYRRLYPRIQNRHR